MSIIIWIDPGTTTVWYAIIEKTKTLSLIDYWVIHTTPKIALSLKLLEIGSDLSALFKRYTPEKVVVEELFFTKNIKTWIAVAQSRGTILYEIAKHNILLLEFTPLEVKKAITGNGQASKKQMQLAIKMILRLKEIPKPDDAADAIGLAYLWALQR
jgi:crossover junction endodeoxyribonuclease RuvC